uniref:RNA-binding protein 34 n=1 Tax=Nannospalax galili TaxID=1026970 RepID=A0A8C6W4T2_NANGA
MASGRKARKRKKDPDTPDDGEGRLAADYLVGQVADSLPGARALGGRAAPLASLFAAAPRAPPVFVPVPQETFKKRKSGDEEESTSQIQRPVLQEPAKKMEVKNLSDGAKRLANRESALASADLEEEILQEQGQKRKKSKSSVKAAGAEVLNDVDLSLDVGQRKKTQINLEEERLKNERTVFVGNLPVTCSKKMPGEGTLSKKLAAIKRKFHPDQKSINAYVVFKEESAASEALRRNGAQIAEGFRIRVDFASETSSRDKRSVFVGNLPYKVEESALEKHFLDCGNIVAVKIVKDPLTGVGRGFGYVLFENTDAVHLALKLNNSELMGRKPRVMHSLNKEKLKRQNSNPTLKKASKPKQGLHFASSDVGNSKSVFIGEKAVLVKKKKGQKKNVRAKKSRKQK